MRLRLPRCSIRSNNLYFLNWTDIEIERRCQSLPCDRHLSIPTATVCNQGTSGTIFHLPPSQLCSNAIESTIASIQLSVVPADMQSTSPSRPPIPLCTISCRGQEARCSMSHIYYSLQHDDTDQELFTSLRIHFLFCYLYSTQQHRPIIPAAKLATQDLEHLTYVQDHHRIFLAFFFVLLSMPYICVLSAYPLHKINQN